MTTLTPRHSCQHLGHIHIGKRNKPKRILSFQDQQELRQAVAKLYAAIECTSSPVTCYYSISEADKIIRSLLKRKV